MSDIQEPEEFENAPSYLAFQLLEAPRSTPRPERQLRSQTGWLPELYPRNLIEMLEEE